MVENRPGAGGAIGTELTARAAPDGHTLFLTVPSLVTNQFYFKSSIDPARLASVVQMTAGAYLLLSSAKFTGRSVGEIMQMIRAKPGSVTCAMTGGQGSIGCEMLKSAAKIDIVPIPYKGTVPAMQDLLGNQISSAITAFATAARGAHHRGGQGVRSGLLRPQDSSESGPVTDKVTGALSGIKGVLAVRYLPRA